MPILPTRKQPPRTYAHELSCAYVRACITEKFPKDSLLTPTNVANACNVSYDLAKECLEESEWMKINGTIIPRRKNGKIWELDPPSMVSAENYCIVTDYSQKEYEIEPPEGLRVGR